GNPVTKVLLKLIISVHRIRRRCYNLILAESKFKNLVLGHQDKYMMKAQVHVSKSSAISDEQALPQRKYYCQIYQMINFTSGVKWCQKPGHLAARLGCAETKVATWDDLAFKIMPFG
nr:hypothetical protein [Tanacetum cinerariifolium]